MLVCGQGRVGLPGSGSVSRRTRRLVRAEAKPQPEDFPTRRRSSTPRPPPAHHRSSNSYDKKNKRRGRPAWQRSPDDTPLRDGNRDAVVGLLTLRAAKTLAYYLSETNLHVYHWLVTFIKENPIPRDGAWDDVSGESFLKKLLNMAPDEAKFKTGRDSMYDNSSSMTVDPRQIAQRIMEVRAQLSREFIQDLRSIEEENNQLLRDALAASLTLAPAAEHPIKEEALVVDTPPDATPGT